MLAVRLEEREGDLRWYYGGTNTTSTAYLSAFIRKKVMLIPLTMQPIILAISINAAARQNSAGFVLVWGYRKA